MHFPGLMMGCWVHSNTPPRTTFHRRWRKPESHLGLVRAAHGLLTGRNNRLARPGIEPGTYRSAVTFVSVNGAHNLLEHPKAPARRLITRMHFPGLMMGCWVHSNTPPRTTFHRRWRKPESHLGLVRAAHGLLTGRNNRLARPGIEPGTYRSAVTFVSVNGAHNLLEHPKAPARRLITRMHFPGLMMGCWVHSNIPWWAGGAAVGGGEA